MITPPETRFWLTVRFKKLESGKESGNALHGLGVAFAGGLPHNPPRCNKTLGELKSTYPGNEARKG